MTVVRLPSRLRDSIRVETVRRTGEVRISPPNGGPSVRINNRRTDGTRAVESLLTKHRMMVAADGGDDTEGDDPMPTPVKPSPEEVARAFVKGRTTEEVLRVMASEAKADPRIVALVARYNARDERRARREAEAGG